MCKAVMVAATEAVGSAQAEQFTSEKFPTAERLLSPSKTVRSIPMEQTAVVGVRFAILWPLLAVVVVAYREKAVERVVPSVVGVAGVPEETVAFRIPGVAAGVVPCSTAATQVATRVALLAIYVEGMAAMLTTTGTRDCVQEVVVEAAACRMHPLWFPMGMAATEATGAAVAEREMIPFFSSKASMAVAANLVVAEAVAARTMAMAEAADLAGAVVLVVRPSSPVQMVTARGAPSVAVVFRGQVGAAVVR
jgi:hypothetical protein